MSSIRKRLGLEEMTDLDASTSIRERLGLSDYLEEEEKAPLNQTPIKGNINTTTEKKKGLQEYLNTSVLDDGYQFGDISKTLLNTFTDAKQDIFKSAGNLAETVVDTGADIVGRGADLIGLNNFAESTRKFIAKDLINEEEYGNMMANTSGIGIINNLVTGNIKNSFVPSQFKNEAFEKNSLSGVETDSIIQSAGQMGIQLGLQAVGVPWQVTAGVSSYGSEIENAYRNGATSGEALFSGSVSAGAEILSEYLFKIPGIKMKGTGVAGDAIGNKLAKLVSNTATRNLANWGINLAGEGAEEVISNFFQNLGQALSYEREDTLEKLATDEEARNKYVAQVGEKLFGEEAREGYKKSFIAGAALSAVGGAPTAVAATMQGRDINTGLTNNEQAILNKEIETRKEEATKDGKELSKSEVKKIEEQAREDLESGNIDTNLIESELGGDTYNQYKETSDKVRNIENEIKELSSKKMTELSVGEYNDTTSRLNALREELKKIDTNTQRSKLDAELGNKIKSDMLLQRSFTEKAQKGQTYNADLTKYDAKQKKTIQSAIDSGILNNTRKTHDFVDMVAKLSADKGVTFNFANNQKIKDSGFAVEGKNVDGFVNQNGITLNIESNNALNKVVGHEITHILEGTDLYTDLQTAVKDYATTKGVWNTKLADLTERYKNIEGANVENELTSDLVGEYLFTDSKFVSDLSANKPNLFQKIYNEIKYMLKIATAGSKEARQLEKVKKTFEDAYKTKGANLTSDSKYSLFKNKPVADNTISQEFADEITEKTRKNINNVGNAKMVDINKISSLLDTGGYRTQEDVTKLENSIMADGIKEPIELKINSNGDLAIENGNHRLAAAIKMGLKEIPVTNSELLNGKNTKYSVSEKTQRAIDTMGITNNPKLAGYLTADGQYLDFSGKYQGSDGKSRQMDHREISDVYTDEEYDNAENKHPEMGSSTAILQDFIEDGNIRLNETGLEIATEPTKEQYDKIYDYLDYVKGNNDEVFIDLDTETKNRENLEYDVKTSVSKMINDIKNHYSNKYSLSDEIAPREAGNTYSEDVKLQEQIAPLQEQVSELSNQITELSNKMDKQLTGEQVTEADLPMMEQQQREALDNIKEEDITGIDNENNYSSLDEVNIRNKNEIISEIKNDFGINQQEARELYNTIANKNVASIDDVVEELENYRDVKDDVIDTDLKDLKKVLKKTKINVSEIKNQITDYNNFRKSNFGKLRLTNEGMTVDEVYEELSDTYPQYFSKDVINDLDRLETIADLANKDIRSNERYELDDNTLYDLAQRMYADIGNKERYAASEKQMDLFNKNIKSMEAPVEDASDTNDIAPVKEEYEAIEPNREVFNKGVMKRIKEVERDLGYSPKDPTKESSYEEIAKVLDTEPTTENTRNKRKAAIVAANVLDKGLVFENVALKNKNRNLMGKWDYTLTSEARAQNVIGNGHYELDPVSKSSKQVSKSLNDIRAEVDNTGLTKQFYEYMYHKHNVDRMSLEGKYEDVNNKPVFGNDVDAAASQEIVNQYEFSNPEFMDYAQDVYNYLEADRNQLVKEGVISQETADLWQEMYPHYVPIRRVDSKGLNINVPLDTGRTGINAPIKKATGGNTDILPLFDTMAQRTLQTYRATAKNSFGVELKNTLGTTLDSQQTNIDDVIDNIDTQDGLLQENDGKPTFTVFENGEKVTFAITQDMYDAMKPLNDSSILSKTFTPLNVASSIHRGLLTQYNPIFALTNGIKDAHDILINSQHPAKTYSKLGEAWGQYLKKGYWYNEYVANGGEQNSYFDSQDNSFKTENTGIKKILDLPPLKQIAQLNDFIEIGPRLAEYIASREAGRNVEVSMLDAARVTTNFKAGGNVTKFLNRNGATFLNASVQGAMQQVRNVREAKANGVKGWMSLAAKFAVAGLPAMLLNSLLWDDDDEYDELSDYVKQNYYIVGKDDEGNFIRIPKGRTLAVIQEGLKQMESLATGNDEADLKTFIDLALNNLAPNNPIENNIFSPVIQVANNKTWYGGDLVPTRLQDLPAAEQYDESTDNFSRWLGETLNVSPYKVNYMLNQYSGGLGDVVMPMMTPEATTNAETTGEQLLAPLKSKFTSSSVMNNQSTADFYETSEELTTAAKKSAATDEDVLKNKFINSVKAEMNDLYKEKRDIQNSDLSKSEKYNQVLEVQRQINELTKGALNDYENVDVSSNYAKVGNREYRLNKNEEWEKIDAKQLEKQNEVTNYLGIDANDYWGNKEEYDYAYENPDKYAVGKAVGGYDTYKSYSKELYDLKADKDSNGKTINGSRKEKVLDYVNNLDADYGQKIILYKSEYPSDDDYNYDIIDYLNEREDISYEDMKNILTELDMTIDADGNIHW